MRLLLALALLGFAATTYAEGWLCVADEAAGFRYDKKAQKWNPTTFKTDSKYVIKPRPSTDTLDPAEIKWHVVEVGNDHPSGFCEDPDKNGWLACDGLVGELTLKVPSLRFTNIHTGLYYVAPKDMEETLIRFGRPKDSQPDDTVMEIGRCTAL